VTASFFLRSISTAFVVPILCCSMVEADDAPSFARHVIDPQFDNGYQTSVADINSDGKPDIVALATGPSQLVWYKNPTWKRFNITSKTKNNIDVAPHDIDNDGDRDLVLESDFSLNSTTSAGTVQWLECPADPASNQEWEIHPIGAVPTAHRVRSANVSGDEKMELLVQPILGVGATPPEHNIAGQFRAFVIPTDPKSSRWDSLLIDQSLCVAHGMRVVRWNANDLHDSILTASFEGVHLFQVAADGKSFIKTQVGIGDQNPRPKQGSSEVALGTAGGSRFIATIEPWHGNQVVVYTEESPGKFPWPRTVIDSTFQDGHALAIADFDKDGNDEIAAGYRGGDHSMYLFQFSPASKSWERTPIDQGGISAAGMFVADINQDTYLDIVATGTATDNVVWYENITGKVGK
jgi:hypothetical protein